MGARIPRWSQLRPAPTARPLSTVERQEYHAIRLGLLLALGILQNHAFMPEWRPIPGDHENQLDWLRLALKPLVRHSPTIALAVRLIHLDGPAITWNDPAMLGRHLQRIAEEVRRLGKAMRSSRH